MVLAGLDAVVGVLLFDVLVEKAQRLDRPAPLVRQEVVGDPALLGEPGERLDRIVANGEEGDAGLVVPRLRLLQLDELRLAERSPACAAVEEHERPTASAPRVEVDALARLIR
jgi:hypothetical protein